MGRDWNLLTTDQAAKQLGVSGDAVRRYFHSGVLAGRRHGRILLVEQRAVLALIKIIAQARSGQKPSPPTRPSPAPQTEIPHDDRFHGNAGPFPLSYAVPVAEGGDAGSDPSGC